LARKSGCEYVVFASFGVECGDVIVDWYFREVLLED
jgi:hypothetical protein